VTAVSEIALPTLLSTDEVAERYGCEARAARRIMREAGALAAAGRLFIRADALDVWERTQTGNPPEPARAIQRRRGRRGGVDPKRLSGLGEGWWKAEG
jgi:hypothetical protein